MTEPEKNPRVLVLAYGSIGDALPAVIAAVVFEALGCRAAVVLTKDVFERLQPRMGKGYSHLLLHTSAGIIPSSDTVPIDEIEELYEVVEGFQPNALLYNLCTLAGYHIAGCLGIPHAILNPTFLPRTPKGALAAQKNTWR